jgi:O-antigen/teichoic acid export membrane protein
LQPCARPSLVADPAGRTARGHSDAPRTGAAVTSPTVWQRFRLQQHKLINDPLARTSLPLIINIGSNGLLGVLYWMVAARLYDTQTVATNSAVLAAMTTLSGVTQLNLNQTLPVIVPRARERARLMIGQVYGVITGFALLVLAVFIFLVLPHLSELSGALHSPAHLLVFAGGLLIYNIFAMQDAALISLRRQKLIPFENATFGAAKLLLLIPLMVLLPTFGIFASWIIPLVILVPIVSVLIFRRPPPAVAAPAALPRKAISKLALDYLGYLFLVGSTFLLPVIALELLPSIGAAVFAIAWQTSSTVDLLASNMGTALTVETSYGGDPGALRRTALRHGLLLVGTVAALGALLAPEVLSLYGREYRQHGVTALRLLLLAGIPRCLATFAIAEARAHAQIGFIVRLRAQNFIVGLGLALLLAPHYGVSGMALGWLGSQILSGLVALRRLLKWSPSQNEPTGVQS